MSHSGSSVNLDDFLESSSSFQSYINLDGTENIMKKTILVYGLPGPQASSVCSALVG